MRPHPAMEPTSRTDASLGFVRVAGKPPRAQIIERDIQRFSRRNISLCLIGVRSSAAMMTGFQLTVSATGSIAGCVP